MSLESTLAIASGGIRNVNHQMAIVSQNIANASTPGYAAEISTQTSVTAGGQGMGVHSGPAMRNVDAELQGEIFSETATIADLQTRQSALEAVDATQGTPGQGGDMVSLLGKLQEQFSTLLNNPDSQPQQTQTVAAATTLAQSVNNLSNSYTAQRQAAQDDVVNALQTVNNALTTIGTLSNRIISLRSDGRSTADLESQRDTAIEMISQLLAVKVLQQPSGDVLVTTSAGLMLPTHGGQLSTIGASVQTGSFHPGGGIPPILLGGADVTSQLRGGRIGADLDIRDTIMPTYQAELDEFAETMASRFDAQGLTLFSDPSGTVPVSAPPPVQNGYVGFSVIIQVNPALLATPSLLRDGTHPVVGNPAGPSAFVPNPPGGPAGFTAMIERILNFALGPNVQNGVLQPPPNTANLGPTGTLNAPFTAPTTLSGFAGTIIGTQAQDAAHATSQLATEQAVQSALTAKFSSVSGVSMDTEMSHMIELQNAYGANARVIASVQAMWTQLLNAVS